MLLIQSHNYFYVLSIVLLCFFDYQEFQRVIVNIYFIKAIYLFCLINFNRFELLRPDGRILTLRNTAPSYSRYFFDL
jgi:hypothetical protein